MVTKGEITHSLALRKDDELTLRKDDGKEVRYEKETHENEFAII